MLINIAGAGIIFVVLGFLLILRGYRRPDVESASIGGMLVGAGLIVLAVQFFYIFQYEDEGGGYRGTLVTEVLLGACLMVGLALIIISLYGWARHVLFWQFFVKAGRT